MSIPSGFIAVLITAFSLLVQPGDKVRLITVKIPDVCSVQVPESFQRLSDDQIADKIIASRKPMAMFSSPNGQADFSVSVGNSSKNPWEDKDLKLMADFQKANIRQLFTSVTFLTDKVIKVRGQSFADLEFISEVKEKTKPPVRKYNRIRYTIRKKNVLVFSFTCPESERPLLEGLAADMLASVRF